HEENSKIKPGSKNINKVEPISEPTSDIYTESSLNVEINDEQKITRGRDNNGILKKLSHSKSNLQYVQPVQQMQYVQPVQQMQYVQPVQQMQYVHPVQQMQDVPPVQQIQ